MRPLALFLLPLATLAASAQPGPPPTDVPQQEVVIHDPVMAEDDGMYYLFGTGNGIDVWRSEDLELWDRLPVVFEETPAWVMEILPEFERHIWAPDIVEHEGTFYLYYSVSAFGRNTSAIGVVTNETLDPESPEYEWIDHGPVVQSVPGRDNWNAIDAGVFFDAEGTPWMSFGSHWGGLKLAKLDADDLTRLETDRREREWHTIAARHRFERLDERDAGDSANPELDYDALYPDTITELNRLSESGAIEAPFVIQKDGWYYLFVSWDRCCRGVNSTYKVLVGRSREATGPFLDRAGQDLRYGGGTLVVEGFGEDSDRWAAGGHNSAYTFDGTDYLVFHAYDKTADGLPRFMLREIEWDEGGWPTVSVD